MLCRGFDLPPLMFTSEEIEAIAAGVRLVARTGDSGLQDAAESVLSKVTTVLPETLRAQLMAEPFFVSFKGPRHQIASIWHGANCGRTIDIFVPPGSVR